VVATCDFFNSYPAFGTIGEIASCEPVSQFFCQKLFTCFAFMLVPRLLALATELKGAVLAGVHFYFVLIALCNFVALRIGTIGFLRVNHNV